MKSTPQLYLVAILPPKAVYTKIRGLQHQIKNSFGCKQALKPPVHITLQAPFRWPLEEEHSLIEQLKAFGSQSPSFMVNINGFGSFEPHTIFAKPEKTSGLMEHQKNLLLFLETNLGLKTVSPYPQFEPHFTLAYRDINDQYPQIWKHFKARGFVESFMVNGVCLLKHNGFFWEVMKEFPLNGK